jgi:hypothetical protein
MHFVGFGFKPPEKSPDPIIIGCSVDNRFFLGFCKTLKRGMCWDFGAPAKGHHIVKFYAVIRRISPRFNSPVRQGTPGIRDDEIQINVNGPAKPPACLARANRAVKREEIGDWFAVLDFAVRAFKSVAECKVSDSTPVLPYPQIQTASPKAERLL